MNIIKNNLECPCCKKILALIQEERGQANTLMEMTSAKKTRVKYKDAFEVEKVRIRELILSPKYLKIRAEYREVFNDDDRQIRRRNIERKVQTELKPKFMDDGMRDFMRLYLFHTNYT